MRKKDRPPGLNLIRNPGSLPWGRSRGRNDFYGAAPYKIATKVGTCHRILQKISKLPPMWGICLTIMQPPPGSRNCKRGKSGVKWPAEATPRASGHTTPRLCCAAPARIGPTALAALSGLWRAAPAYAALQLGTILACSSGTVWIYSVEILYTLACTVSGQGRVTPRRGAPRCNARARACPHEGSEAASHSVPCAHRPPCPPAARVAARYAHLRHIVPRTASGLCQVCLHSIRPWPLTR